MEEENSKNVTVLKNLENLFLATNWPRNPSFEKLGHLKQFPEPPFTIVPGNVEKELQQLQKSGKSILKTDTEYIVFCGLTTELSSSDRACVHMELKNTTDKVGGCISAGNRDIKKLSTNETFLFNIRTPACPMLFVKPHVGMIEPKKSTTLYFTFKAKCHRIPSNFCWIYCIYHIVIEEKDTAWIKEDEFSTHNLRRVWNEKGKGDIGNILYLSCKFDPGKMPEREPCRGHNLQKKLFLNEQGEVQHDYGTKWDPKPEGQIEGSTGKKVASSSSDTTDVDIPKTADSNRVKKK